MIRVGLGLGEGRRGGGAVGRRAPSATLLTLAVSIAGTTCSFVTCSRHLWEMLHVETFRRSGCNQRQDLGFRGRQLHGTCGRPGQRAVAGLRICSSANLEGGDDEGGDRACEHRLQLLLRGEGLLDAGGRYEVDIHKEDELSASLGRWGGG
mgnify:CR=1 FL=1